MDYLTLFTHIVLVISLGWYLITNLQWYNYKIQRVILKHHKKLWHFVYFVVPFTLYYLLDGLYFQIYFYILYLPSLILWHRKLDKKLVMTQRVKRFLSILLTVTIFIDILLIASNNTFFTIFVPLALTYIITTLLEKMFFIVYKRRAKQRLKNIRDLKIITITASYGKTSIKNYMYQVLSKQYNVYMTPRSVNTIGGIIKDVNDDIPLDTQVYIAEAGAREQGDIEDIVNFLEPQYAIIGSVGEQHIEYFKTLDNIIYTKMEVLKSPKLEHAFVHTSVPILDYDTITQFPNSLKIIKSNLDGLEFSIDIDGSQESFIVPILGSFNAINLTAVILMAKHLNISLDTIRSGLKNLKQVNHRLHLSKTSTKVILDDSFNGNIKGMLEACNIANSYDGRKVIVTPGVVESDIATNITLANKINEVFDLVILTGSLNKAVLEQHITNPSVVILEDKSQMENTLLKHTQDGDLILFANDAPNFI